MTTKSVIPVTQDRAVARREQNPFSLLQHEIDRLFDGFTRSFAPFSQNPVVPNMDVAETDKEIEITAELPGLEEKDVQINVADNLLTIRGEKRNQREEKDKDYHVVERSYGSFLRTVELPAGVNLDTIKAAISKGILKVTVPKPAPSQVKKIEVKTAA
ncbi:MAG: Hsp20/alpha crystallin family protein [Afipia sp.]|nr:Hsp20/alpha crystallin family protein [Afipia sp.]